MLASLQPFKTYEVCKDKYYFSSIWRISVFLPFIIISIKYWKQNEIFVKFTGLYKLRRDCLEDNFESCLLSPRILEKEHRGVDSRD